jgi:hypothetical protein
MPWAALNTASNTSDAAAIAEVAAACGCPGGRATAAADACLLLMLALLPDQLRRIRQLLLTHPVCGVCTIFTFT